jgi:acetolactate synthase-1/2/3 large subunit
MGNMIKVSDYIVKRLHEVYGVEHVFLIPGGGAMHLNDSFGNCEGLKYIVNHHEQACAIAAEAYARVTGKIGVVNVTSGPGGLNTLTGVMGQWTDSVPVIYISGQIKQETSIYAFPELKLRQLGDQEGDIINVVKPITKFAETIRDARQTKLLLDKAIYMATTGRPGPVWLDVPLDVQGAQIDEKDLLDFVPETPRRSPEFSKISEVVALLQKAERPVIVAGHGIRISGAQKDFLDLTNSLKVPILTTFNGVDVIPSDNEYFVGRIGTLGSRAGNFALQNSDLLISIGSRNNIRQVSYNWKSFARAAKKVVVDIDESEIKKPLVIPDLPIVMDAREFIKALRETLGTAKTPDFSKWLNWCIERKHRYSVVLPEYYEERELVNPYVFVEKLTRKLPDGAIVVTGNGTACVAAFQAAIVKPGQRYFWNSGCATMGYDLPAAVGASIATGNSPVICLSGDGSFMMNMQEMATIAYLNLPIKIFLLNNFGYVSMRQTQGAFFNGRMTAVDPDSGVGFPKFQALAAAFGFKTLAIESNGEIERIVDEVLKINGPTLCEVMMPKDYKFAPKLSSVKLDDGRMISKPLEDLSPLLERAEFKSNMIIPILEE